MSGRQDTIVRRTWLGCRLIVATAVFVSGKCEELDVKEYDARKMPAEQVRQMLEESL